MSKTAKKRSGSKGSKKTSNEKTIEEKYKKMTPHEHILHLPDTYIGSIKKETCNMWIFNNSASEGDPKIIFKEISYVPGFYKICDEVFVNAADHTKRCKTCTVIKIWIDKATGRITVWNNGDGIDVVEHKEHKILVPAMLFTELLTSTNYDKNEKKTVGGRNGFGAKLANIYSTEFDIETIDAKRGLKFKQKCSNNMYTKGKPLVKPAAGKKPYTKFSFVPDFEKFGLKGITSDMMALLKKRAYDLAMTTGARVYYNDELIAENSFAKYIDLYFPQGSGHEKVLDVKNHKRWKVCAVYDPTGTLEHQNISFVNSICTSRGGTHVDSVVNQVVKRLKEAVQKKIKGTDVKPAMIKENLIFFIDSTIVNPEFDTQSKECLKLNSADFGSRFTVTDIFIKNIIKTGVVNQIIANAEAKAQAGLIRDSKGKVNLNKLYEATRAKLKKGDCTLILTEGDSAKGFAMSGLNVIGREDYSVFPLKGKMLNVREATAEQLKKNDEIKAIMKIMGLEPGKDYTDTKGLRHGRIMVLADSDTDGHHIKGLVMNFIHFFWPSLLKIDGFIESFATPILKATKGKGKNAKVIDFNSIPIFEEWKKKNNDGKGWKIKYYKGLATSTSKEAQECFKKMDDAMVEYFWQSKIKSNNSSLDSKSHKKKIKSEFIDDQESPVSDILSDQYKPRKEDMCEDALTLAFDGEQVRRDDRKLWINNYDPDNYIDGTERKISYHDFIHKELITFSVENASRSIPNIMDGFKPSQRKVYKGSVDEGIYKEEIQVAALGGAVTKRTKYHHGEKSMQDTIVGMAQNFVGSNNINLLKPIGQFGTRLCGGADAGSARYIHTQLDNLGKKIFIENDHEALEDLQQYEDGKEIEPKYYAPIIPMILVNGSKGIGTGYSTTIEPCDPRDVYANIKRIMAGEKPKAMKPWYRHSNGPIEKVDTNKYVSRAKYDLVDDDTIHITDLPVGTWTDNYKAFLNALLDQSAEQKADDKRNAKNSGKGSKGAKGAKGSRARSGSKKQAKFLAKKSQASRTAKVAKSNPIARYIKTYTEDCTDIRVSFTITFHPGKLRGLLKNGTLEKHLKLVTPLNLTNMHLFDETGKLRKYNSYSAILKHFVRVRLDLYQKRKDYLLGKWRQEMDILKWKVKFIEAVISEKIVVFKGGRSKKKAEVIERLEELKYPKFILGQEKNASYNYLTDIKLFDLTEEKVEELRKLLREKKEEIATLECKSPSQMWDEELDDFMDAYDKWEAECDEEYDELMSSKNGTAGKKRKRQPRKTAAKKKANDSESENDSDASDKKSGSKKRKTKDLSKSE